MSSLKMVIPQNVFINDDIHGKCVSHDIWPHIVIKRTTGCNFKIENQRRFVVQDTIKYYCIDFVVKNVTATCEYMCAVKQFKVIKTVVVSGMYAASSVTMHPNHYMYIYTHTLLLYVYRCHNITNTFEYNYF